MNKETLNIGTRWEVCWDNALFESADGVHFEEKCLLMNDGTYDSLNVCFWDAETQQYYLFYRCVHGEGTANEK